MAAGEPKGPSSDLLRPGRRCRPTCDDDSRTRRVNVGRYDVLRVGEGVVRESLPFADGGPGILVRRRTWRRWIEGCGGRR